MDPDHLLLSSNDALNTADHKSTSFNKTVRKLNSRFDDQTPKGVLICGLPFKCERSFFWDQHQNGLEVVCYDSGDTVETDNGLFHIQFYYVLQLELLRADKPVKKASVSMRVTRSPGAGAMTQVSDDEDNTNNNYDFDD
jgi:hypothetical protein